MKRENTGLTNAQKHDLLIKFNQERAEVFDGYQTEKALRKTQKGEE